MRRPLQRAVITATAAIAILTQAASTTQAAPGGLTSLELRNEFVQCGFEIGNPTAPAASPYVVIRDPGALSDRNANYRIVMAIVYQDATAARAAHQKAHQQAEQRIGETWPWSDDHGPQLLAGYAGSVWRANIAMVQSNAATLASMWSVDGQTDEARIARPELFELTFDSNSTRYSVDRDFVGCLEDAPAMEATVPPSVVNPIVPNFIQGQPW